MKGRKLFWLAFFTLALTMALAATAYADDNAKVDLSSDDCQVTWDLVNEFADGNAVVPEVTVLIGDEAVAPENYEVICENNTAVTSEALITVKAKEDSELITGEKSGTFRIVYSFSKHANVTLSWSSKVVKFKKNDNYKVITTAQKPTVKSVTGYGGEALIKDTDYTVKFTTPSSKNAGTYKITLTAKEDSNYTGSIVKTYKITPMAINNVDFYSYTPKDYYYTGKKIVPKTVKIGYYKSSTGVGMNLVKGTHYTVTKAATFSNNVKIGYPLIKITIKGKGNFKGTKVVTGGFCIGPTKATVKTLTAGKKQFTVTWKKSPKADGYIVLYYGYNDKGAVTADKQVIVKPNTTLKKTIKNLKSGYYYTVYVFSYKTVDGDKVYVWDNANCKTVKVK